MIPLFECPGATRQEATGLRSPPANFQHAVPLLETRKSYRRGPPPAGKRRDRRKKLTDSRPLSNNERPQRRTGDGASATRCQSTT
jgi:hypothetical protein